MVKFISGLFLTIVILSAAILNSCNNNQETSATSEEDSVAQLLKRGDYLVHSVVNCVDCHSQLDLTKFSLPLIPGTEGQGGLAVHDIDPIPGKVFIPNITPYALKDWTDEEIARAMTRGINRDGDTLFPVMPYHGLSRLAKRDVDAIITYIRSLKPIKNDVPKHQFFVPAASFGPLPDNDYRNNTMPDTADKVKYGEYLVTIAHCTDCHTPMTPENMPDLSKYLAGGHHFKFATVDVTVANITPDTATGIGGWSEQMFLAKFRNNADSATINRDPGKYNTIMPWSFFGTMTDGDLKAIYAYLRTVKPVHHLIEKWPQ